MPCAGMGVPVIYRASCTYATPTQNPNGTWRLVSTGVTTGPVGSFRIEIGAVWDFTGDIPVVDTAGIDITTINGVRTQIQWMTFTEPYGEMDAAIALPRVALFDAPAWLQPGANIDIYRVLPPTEALLLGVYEVPHWHGFVANDPLAQDNRSLACMGALFGEITARAHQPVMRSAARDIGTVLGHALAPQDYARPFNRYRFMFESATTGINVRVRGSRGQHVVDHVDEVLALAQDDTSQWTISRAFDVHDIPQARKYYLRRKGIAHDSTPIQANTLTVGGWGVKTSLSRDLLAAPNAVYGEGTTPIDDAGRGGDRWRNAKFPALFPAKPAYPSRVSGPTYPVAAGDEDSDFTADVVTQLQYALRAAAMPDTEITGVFDADTTSGLRELQRQAGITVTGTVADAAGWDAVFATSALVSDIDSGYFRPLSEVTESAQYRYAANGAVLGANDSGPTAYDGRLRIEQTISHGDVSKGDAITWSRRLAQQANDGPVRAGQIVLTSDPVQRSRFLFREGSWARVDGLDGGGTLGMYVASVRQEPDSPGLPVQLTVAAKAWDLLSLAARLDRDRDAATDPARSFFSQRMRKDRPFRDAVGWDRESGAGIIREFSHPGGEWVITRFTAGQVGRILGISARTSDPTEFAVALFAKAVTAAEVAGVVADPLVDVPDYGSPFLDPANDADLNALGFLEVWGSADEPCGYSPGSLARSSPLSGRLVDAASWDFVSFDPPYLWAAWWCVDAATARARLRIAIADEA